jgi:YlmC/YmxH family sporulation protein
MGMCETFSELRCKEVINVSDGARLGYVCDLELRADDGRVLAIVVPGRCKLLGLGPAGEDYVIPWDCIRRIGADIILVDIRPEEVCRPRKKKSLFS